MMTTVLKKCGPCRSAMGGRKPALVLGHAEIGALKELWRNDHLRARERRLSDEIGRQGDVGLELVAEWRLQRRERQSARHQAGCCWVMQ